MEKIKSLIKELWVYLLILIVVILLKLFVVAPIRVNGPSMEDTLHDKDIMILDQISYRFNKIERFDIVVINHDDEYLIKRIVGLPGEKIKYENNKLYINGKYIKEDFSYEETEDIEEITIPKGTYYVLGDNRINSADSRIIGFIDKEDIKGKTSLTIYPFDRFGNKE